MNNAPPEVLVEGVPAYLTHPLVEWLRTEAGWHRPHAQGGVDQAFLQKLALTVRIPVSPSSEMGGISNQITTALSRDENLFLDALDAALYLRGRGANAQGLRTILEMGSSAWTVSPAGSGLMRRVQATAVDAFTEATNSADTVSAELIEAWNAVFGRTPNPSDAWDHAIKAVEELLIPLVIPAVAKPNLGGVAGELHGAAEKWHLAPSTSSTTFNDGLTIEAMLRLIWPNPDRHGGGAHRRPPTQAEAEAVVHLAVAIVQLCRDGGLTKTPST